MTSELSALYYPYATIRNMKTLAKTLLVFDHIYLIYPTQEYAGLRVQDNETSRTEDALFYRDARWDRYSNIKQPSLKSWLTVHNLHELMYRDILRIITPADTVAEYRDFMLEELKKDQEDPQFQNQKSRSGWELFVEKIPEPILNYPEFKPFRDFSRNVIRLPFVEGESIMISHAICGWWAKAQEGELISPITDERIHQKLLEYRLERGIKAVEPAIQNNVSVVSIRKAIDLFLPEPPNNIEYILTARREKSTTLRKIRECIKKIAAIMQNPTDNFELEISKLNEEIMIAYSEMGQEYGMQGRVIRTHKWFNKISDRYSLAIGGSSGTAIGTQLSLLPSPGVGLLSSQSTSLAQEAYSDIEKLRNPIIGYRVGAK